MPGFERRFAHLLVLAALGALAAPASGQPVKPPQRDRSSVAITNAPIGRYEGLYGTPEDIPLEEVIRMLERGEPFGHAVRTRGRFQDPDSREGGPPGGVPEYALCEGQRCLHPIRPAEEIAREFHAESVGLRARELEIVGAFESGYFLFWSYSVATPSPARPRGPGAGSTLEALVTGQAPLGSRDLTVRGQFRGRNLFGDLPAGSEATAADWVIGDGSFSVWVTGKAPKGSGFALDPASRADCAFWLEVEGRPEKRGDVVVLKARRVRFLGRSAGARDPR